MLRNIRKARGLTQTQLGDRIGKSKSTISGWENKRNVMELDNAMNLADILGCEITDLYEWVYVDPSERKRKRKGK
ncbi:MAG: helix-turn-helix transcriptional regulator [Bacillus sp. (in: firmicutes)]